MSAALTKSRGIQVTMLLADFAQVYEGKLTVVGGGWGTVGVPQQGPTAIGMVLAIPWDQTNTPLNLLLKLTNADGHPVTAPGPAGQTPVEVQLTAEVGRPPGMTAGSPMNLPLGLNFPPMALEPGRYSWTLTINGLHHDGWSLDFEAKAFPTA